MLACEDSRGGHVGKVRWQVAVRKLAQLRASADVAVVPSRFAKTVGLAAAAAMVAALPVVAFDVGALGELFDADDLAPPADAASLAVLVEARWGGTERGDAYYERITAKTSQSVVAAGLATVYDG